MNGRMTEVHMVLALVIGLLFCMVGQCDEDWSVVLPANGSDEISAPAEIADVPGAFEGKCVRLNGRDTAPQAYGGNRMSKGHVTMRPTIPEPGNYRLWLRLQWHCTCGRNLALETTATRAESPGGKSIPVRGMNVNDTFRPRVWHWMDCGTYTFEAGVQEVTCIQSGHHVLVDAVALASDPDFRPPGYFAPDEDFQIDRCPKDWRRPAGERTVHVIGEREWANFQLDTSFDIPFYDFDATGSVVGFEFCRQPDDRGYAFQITPTAAGTVDVRLVRNDTGGEVVLAERKGVQWLGSYHATRIARVGGGIDVNLNGQTLLSAEDDTFASGAIAIVQGGVPQFDFHELEIRTVGDFEEHFPGAASTWDVLAGTWRVLSERVFAENDVIYLGAGNAGAPAISRCPWQLGSSYRFRVGFRNSTSGAAGVVLAARDTRNYCAVTVGVKGSASDQRSELKILEYSDGEESTLFTCPLDGEGGQWFQLELETAPGMLLVRADGRQFGPFRAKSWNLGGAPGLYVDDGAEVEFAGIAARQGAGIGGHSYLFEPESDMRSISEWYLETGGMILEQHPATLTLQTSTKDLGSVRLNWKLPVPASAEVRVAFTTELTNKWKKAAPKASLGDNLLQDFPPIVLPNAARVGVAIKLTGLDQAEYFVSVDKEAMREITISRNSEVLVRESVDHRDESVVPEFRVVLSPDGLVASVAGGAEAKLRDSTFGLEGSERRVAIQGENLFLDDRIRIDGIYVTPLYPSLDTPLELGE